jgi:EF-P beta-lysylation protein EpmB
MGDPDELAEPAGPGPMVRRGGAAAEAHAQFPFRVPRGFAARIAGTDPADPLMFQVLPTAAEMDPVQGFSNDPVGERLAPPDRGLLRKYSGRALVMATGTCAVHCRYCFRRHFPYSEHTVGRLWPDTLSQLAADSSLSEVILSGGDPLMLPDERLASMVADVSALRHIRRLRIHTRMPIVLPERVDESLVDWLAATRLPVVVVVHANHPAEIGADVRRACRVLNDAAGVTLLNQSVLLRGVNDDATVLAELSESLFETGVLPYYLHMLDPVAGAAHFEVPDAEAGDIVEKLRAMLPGYLVPRLVREIPGAPSKIPVELKD